MALENNEKKDPDPKKTPDPKKPEDPKKPDEEESEDEEPEEEEEKEPEKPVDKSVKILTDLRDKLKKKVGDLGIDKLDIADQITIMQNVEKNNLEKEKSQDKTKKKKPNTTNPGESEVETSRSNLPSLVTLNGPGSDFMKDLEKRQGLRMLKSKMITGDNNK